MERERERERETLEIRDEGKLREKGGRVEAKPAN
jgi:hypothetical protein